MNEVNTNEPLNHLRLIQRICVGWLAVAPISAVLRLGLTAATRDEAREKFLRSVDRWASDLAAEIGKFRFRTLATYLG